MVVATGSAIGGGTGTPGLRSYRGHTQSCETTGVQFGANGQGTFRTLHDFTMSEGFQLGSNRLRVHYYNGGDADAFAGRALAAAAGTPTAPENVSARDIERLEAPEALLLLEGERRLRVLWLLGDLDNWLLRVLWLLCDLFQNWNQN